MVCLYLFLQIRFCLICHSTEVPLQTDEHLGIAREAFPIRVKSLLGENTVGTKTLGKQESLPQIYII